MTRSQIVQIVVIVLVVAVAMLFLSSRKAPQPPSTPVSAPTTAVVPKKESISGGPEGVLKPSQPAAAPAAEKPAEEEPAVTRDPFQLPLMLREVLRQKELARTATAKPVETQTSAIPIQLPSLKLQGILWGTSKPRAIINRKVLAVGDTIENAQVVSVNKEGVVVSFGGQEYRLRLSTKGGGSSEGGQPAGWPAQAGGQPY